MPTPTGRNDPLALWHRQPGNSLPTVDETSSRQWLDRQRVDDVGRSALRCTALGLTDGTELSPALGIGALPGEDGRFVVTHDAALGLISFVLVYGGRET